MEEEGIESSGDSKNNGHQPDDSEQIIERYVVISSYLPATFEEAVKKWATLTSLEKISGDSKSDYRIYRVTEVNFS